MAAISSIRNLGPAFEAACKRAGIRTAEELRALGADAAYARILEGGERPHFIGYYVLHMALQGRPWNDCKGPEKEALRARFDALKAGRALPSGVAQDPARGALEAFFREFGLFPPKPAASAKAPLARSRAPR